MTQPVLNGTKYVIEYVGVEGEDGVEWLEEFDLLSRLRALAVIGIDEVKVTTILPKG